MRRTAVVLGLLLSAGYAAAQTPAAPAAPPPANQPAQYVGSETCRTCHEDIFNAFQQSPHALVQTDAKYR
ncbi:MAG TPA: hypothetical protein VJ732_08615, partial [Bryobacteraceae bacterium]|nr:hypothetical protein [Bryobacteraceae bacterium]